MLKRLLIITAIIVFCNHNFVFASSSGVVINSFCTRSTENSTEEFIELYNSSNQSVQLKNWRLAKKSATGLNYNLLTAFPEISFEPQKSIIIAHKDYSGFADIRYSVSGNSISDNNTVVIYSDAGLTEVDKVGWGTAKIFEGSPLLNPKPDEIWLRKESGVDTDNNLNDFTLRKEAQTTEGTENNPDSLVIAEQNQIYVTELMPNPEGSDTDGEWIELYNAGFEINLSGFSISDKFGSAKNYVFPEIRIKNNEYFVLYLKGTGISLNNDGDMVDFKDASGNTISSSGESYGSAKEGLSYAFDGEKWQWTKLITPGSENIIEIPETNTKIKTLKPKQTTAKKAKAPKAQVKGSTTNENSDIFAEREANVSPNDKKIGIILIILALVFGLLYTVYTNWSKIREVYIEKRKKYQKLRQKLRQKFKKR